jgi:hypothetical protein
MPYLALGTAELVHVIIDCHDLLCRVGRSGLLSVAKSRVRDPDLIRHVVRNSSVIESYLRNLIVGIQVPERVRSGHVDQGVHILFQLKQVRVMVHMYSSCLIFHNNLLK